MKILGLDIGTTTISAVVTEGRQVLASLTLKNDAVLPAQHAYEKLQDPAVIREAALQAVETLLETHPDVERIGLTGQMHGIVYLDVDGQPVSPLYTWQDGRGDLPYEEGATYASWLSAATGYELATGYGIVTHFYNMKNGLVPENAVVFCAIHDYIAMVLAGKTTPVTDPSDGASFGVFNLKEGCFDTAALKKVGIDPSFLPQLAAEPCIGQYRGNIAVYVAIGDNQASFLGAAAGEQDVMLVNVGTGGQFSVFSREYLECPGLETRPFPGGFLLVGSSLCGGRAYALWERFLADAVHAVTGNRPDSCYDAMDQLLSKGKPENLPKVLPLFQGTRQNPDMRGSITGIGTENFTPRHFAWGLLMGMAEELHGLYLQYQKTGGSPRKLMGSGNGLRKNVHLQACFREVFGQEPVMSECVEEAAVGSALFAGMQI